MEFWFNAYNMKARHEASFGASVSFGKDYLYFGISLWFFNWDIHIACSKKEALIQ